MTSIDTERYRQQLIQLERDLEASRDAAGDAARTVELDQSRVGRLSRMDAMAAQAMSQASSRRREQLQQQIDAALARIDRGQFGICAVCEDPIHPARLDFDPTVVMCVGCAEKHTP